MGEDVMLFDFTHVFSPIQSTKIKSGYVFLDFF